MCGKWGFVAYQKIAAEPYFHCAINLDFLQDCGKICCKDVVGEQKMKQEYVATIGEPTFGT
jgi:hypothetical protein